MREIEYFRPRTVREAVSLLAEKGEMARMLAGGTDILAVLRSGKRQADRLVDAKSIRELNEMTYNPRSGLSLGAAVPCYRIYEDKTISKAYPCLTDSASIIGGIQIQGRATIGGNLCNAAPSADAVPSLIVLGATCVIAGTDGTHRVPVEDFCTGPGQTILRSGELLVSFRIPAPRKNSGACYLRFTPRNEMDIAIAGSAASVVLGNAGKSFISARIALSAVAPTPLLVRETGEYLAGKAVSDEAIEKAAELARNACRPITDMRGTTEQRKHLVYVLTKRALRGAIDRAKENK